MCLSVIMLTIHLSLVGWLVVGWSRGCILRRNRWTNRIAKAVVLFTSNNGGGKCDCPRCLSVCLSVSKITEKRVHGFG